MFSFARRCAFQTCAEGEVLIEEEQDNQFFFVLYEGVLSVSKKGREVARLLGMSPNTERAYLEVAGADHLCPLAIANDSINNTVGLSVISWLKRFVDACHA